MVNGKYCQLTSTTEQASTHHWIHSIRKVISSWENCMCVPASPVVT